MDIETRSRLSTIAVVAMIGGVLSYVYTQAVYNDADGVDAPAWMSFGTGFVIALLVSFFEIWFVSNSRYRFRSLPFLPLLSFRVLVNSTLIMATIIGFQLASDSLSGTTILSDEGLAQTNYWRDYGFSVLITTVAIFYFQVRVFIGGQNLRNMIMGRYHKPHLEERIFLFCDIAGSTKAAIELGDIRFHQFLNELFVLFDKPIVANDGLIHSYVGDAVIATWPLENDAEKNSRALKASAQILELLDKNRTAIFEKFGVSPDVRLALHGGEVVSGETGYSKKQITYLGDTVNTTARLEELSKTLGHKMIASNFVLNRMEVPDKVSVADLGEKNVRGVDHTISVSSLELKHA